MKKFEHQILHLKGVICRTQSIIDQDVKEIAHSDAHSETLRSNIKDYREFIKKTEAAIAVLEGVDSEKDSESV